MMELEPGLKIPTPAPAPAPAKLPKLRLHHSGSGSGSATLLAGLPPEGRPPARGPPPVHLLLLLPLPPLLNPVELASSVLQPSIRLEIVLLKRTLMFMVPRREAKSDDFYY